MKPREKVGILSGDYRQARLCAYERGLQPTEWFYVADRWRLQGLRGVTVWLYGAPHERRDYIEVLTTARAMGCKVVNPPKIPSRLVKRARFTTVVERQIGRDKGDF